MTSLAKIEANRKNALRSTGPRTSAGKARSRRNALRHGLAVPIECDSLFADRIEELMVELSKTVSKPADQIRSAALRYVELERVQEQWMSLLDVGAASASFDAIGGSEEAAEAVRSALQRLPSLSRYERRAISNLRKVLRDLEKP